MTTDRLAARCGHWHVGPSGRVPGEWTCLHCGQPFVMDNAGVTVAQPAKEVCADCGFDRSHHGPRTFAQPAPDLRAAAQAALEAALNDVLPHDDPADDGCRRCWITSKVRAALEPEA